MPDNDLAMAAIFDIPRCVLDDYPLCQFVCHVCWQHQRAQGNSALAWAQEVEESRFHTPMMEICVFRYVFSYKGLRMIVTADRVKTQHCNDMVASATGKPPRGSLQTLYYK